MVHMRAVRILPARAAVEAPVPSWLDPQVRARLAARGVDRLWSHQAQALDLLHAGDNVVLATGTASGKSLVYQLAGAEAISTDPAGTVLYVAPTKALGHDQARAAAWTGLRIGVLDGDTSGDERDWIRAHAQMIVTNPDMLNISILPRHLRWHRIISRLTLVVVDECHTYRGVFGSHTALVLRRLLRLARLKGAQPRVVLASATTGAPGRSAERLIGAPVAEVSVDGSPRGQLTLELLEPSRGAGPQPVTAALLAENIAEDRKTLAFVPSRAGAERVALEARNALADPWASKVRAYRAGLLAEERRTLEASLRDGTVVGAATTNALELGMDIAGLDAVIICGWPGRRASFWQQVGRAGRSGEAATASLVAADDPLDHYLLAHPESIFDEALEETVIDPGNEAILRRHLIAAAAEAPLGPDDATTFGPSATDVLDTLVTDGTLRRRPAGVFWTGQTPPTPIGDIRAIGGEPVRIVEAHTGRLLGAVDAGAALRTVHPGAVYVHQGEYYAVTALELDDHVAFVQPTTDDVFTTALGQSSLAIETVDGERRLGAGDVRRGTVAVTGTVHGFQRRLSGTGQVLSTHGLDLPSTMLHTTGVWWTLPAEETSPLGQRLAGAAHAAEHASIGLLPLVATCDRWDVGGLSTPMHPQTGRCTVFVYDGHPGGVGYAHRGYGAIEDWLAATARTIRACTCDDGCPRCVQSPKCGNGNNPLDKAGALLLLRSLLA